MERNPKTDKTIDTILLILAIVCFSYALIAGLYIVIMSLFTVLFAVLAAAILVLFTLGLILLANDPFGSLFDGLDMQWDAALLHIVLPLVLEVVFLAIFLVRRKRRRAEALRIPDDTLSE